MLFRCRNLIPKLAHDEWTSIEADTPEDAVQEFHFTRTGRPYSLPFMRELPDGTRDEVHFARIEVEGHDSWVSRIFRTGLYRKGGVKSSINQAQKLAKIAAELQWEHDPQELLVEGGVWVGEEAEGH